MADVVGAIHAAGSSQIGANLASDVYECIKKHPIATAITTGTVVGGAVFTGMTGGGFAALGALIAANPVALAIGIGTFLVVGGNNNVCLFLY